MGRSGLVTLLFLVATAVIVMLAAAGGPSGAAGLWAKVTGEPAAPPPAEGVLSPRAMTPTDGFRHVDGAVRDMQAMDSLANSVRR